MGNYAQKSKILYENSLQQQQGYLLLKQPAKKLVFVL